MKEGFALALYEPLLALGISLIMVGMVVLLFSFRPTQSREKGHGKGFFIAFIGFVPIIFGGGRRMLTIGLVAVIVLSLLIGLALMNPNLIGW